VNVYTRGSAKLIDGLARVDLDPTFVWTVNPDIGLTAHLTPRDEPVPLAVEQVSATELVVRGPKGSNVAFDYWVTGLRIGFEQMPAVSPKTEESWIPLRATGDDVYAKAPGLRAYNALERYRSMAKAVGRPFDAGLKAAASLIDRIGIGHPTDTGPEPSVPNPSAVPSLPQGAPVTPESSPSVEGDLGTRPVEPGQTSIPAEPPAPTSWRRPGEMFVATSLIQAGDLVVLDPEVAGGVKRCDKAADRNLVGVAVTPDHDGMVEVAVSEIREVLVDASLTPIAAGDFLTSSATEGAAMRATTDSPGTILGKALEPLGSGIGTIRVLLMPR